MATGLKVLAQFNSGGKEYYAGDVIELSQTKSWPEGALNGRLNNKFVEYVDLPDAVKKKDEK